MKLLVHSREGLTATDTNAAVKEIASTIIIAPEGEPTSPSGDLKRLGSFQRVENEELSTQLAKKDEEVKEKAKAVEEFADKLRAAESELVAANEKIKSLTEQLLAHAAKSGLEPAPPAPPRE